MFHFAKLRLARRADPPKDAWRRLAEQAALDRASRRSESGARIALTLTQDAELRWTPTPASSISTGATVAAAPSRPSGARPRTSIATAFEPSFAASPQAPWSNSKGSGEPVTCAEPP
jgi:hypothetical protein